MKFIERDEIMAHKGKTLILDKLQENFRERLKDLMVKGKDPIEMTQLQLVDNRNHKRNEQLMN